MSKYIAKVSVRPLIKKGTEWTLEDGYIYNRTRTIFIKTFSEFKKYFKDARPS
jgi:hypothetical protein